MSDEIERDVCVYCGGGNTDGTRAGSGGAVRLHMERTECVMVLQDRLRAAEAERDALGSEAVDRLMLVSTLRTRAEQAEAAAAVEVAETREWRTALLRCVAVADQGARTWVENPSVLVAFVAEAIVGLRERVEAAEAAHARHAADRSREVTELHRAHEKALRRAEQAEAERDALGRSLDASASTVALLSAQVGRAEAEVARLRGEYERGLREAAGVLRDAAKKHRSEAEASRSVAASGGHVLAADILESYANMIDLLDAAPAAEVSDG